VALKSEPNRGKVQLRDKVAHRLANAALRIASPWYRSMIRGSIKLGLTAAAIPEPQADEERNQ
jgi:hypothetical protein